MALAVDDYLVGLCPSLVSDANHDMYVAIGQSAIDVFTMGADYTLCVALMAAHEYTLDQTRQMGAGGRISGIMEGRASMTFQEPRSVGIPDKSALLLTQYGQRLKSVFKRNGLSAMVSGGTAAIPEV